MSDQTSSSDEPMDIDAIISAGALSNTARSPALDILPGDNLCESVQHILSNNPFEKNNQIISEEEEQTFKLAELASNSPEQMFDCLQKYFAEHFNIDLHIIGFVNGKFSLFKKTTKEKRHMAFLALNEQNKVRGCLYIVDANGAIKTVFSPEKAGIQVDAYLYVIRFNAAKPSVDTLQIQEQQAVHCQQELREVNRIPPSIDESVASASVQMDDKTQSRMALDQMLHIVFKIIDAFPIDPRTTRHAFQKFISHVHAFKLLSNENSSMACKEISECFSHLSTLMQPTAAKSQTGKTKNNRSGLSQIVIDQPTHIVLQNEIGPSSPNPGIVSNTAPANDDATLVVFNSLSAEAVDETRVYNVPIFDKPLENTIHPRTLLEFQQSGSNPVRCVGSTQREMLTVKIPPHNDPNLYLKVGVTDIFGRTHPAKIVVPKGTKITNELLMNNNDLACLNFNECADKAPIIFMDNSCYFKISSSERQAEKKEIVVHMIDLYKRTEVKNKLKALEEPKKCRLSLAYCTFENDKYIDVSPMSCSNVIVECNGRTERSQNTKKKIKRLSNKPNGIC